MSRFEGFNIMVKGRKISNKMLRVLNGLIVAEFDAIHHYMVHSAVCGGWGFRVLEAKFREESEEELGHSKMLMDRVTVFDKVPTLNQFPAVERPKDVKNMIEKQVALEQQALQDYNDAIRIAREEGDSGTRQILMKILADEERHYDWLKAQLDKIQQMGIQNYLLLQSGEEEIEEEAEKAMGTSSASPMAVESLEEEQKMNLKGGLNEGLQEVQNHNMRNTSKAVGAKVVSGSSPVKPVGGRMPGKPIRNPITSKTSVSKPASARPTTRTSTLPVGVRPSLRRMPKR